MRPRAWSTALPLPPAPAASAAVRVGLATYGSDGGLLKVPMGDLTAASRTTVNSSIDTLAPAGMTPLASTFADIGRYMATGYSGKVATANSTSVDLDALLRLDGTDASPARDACLTGAASCTSSTSPRPIQYWCQRSSLFALTDGRPQHDRSFNNNAYIRDYDGDCSGANASTCASNGAAGSWDRKSGRTYESQGSDYMDDVAKALFDIDLRPDLTKPTPIPPATAAKNNLTTYMIGFADPAVQNDPLLINTARQGGGRFIAATDGPTLVDAFQAHHFRGARQGCGGRRRRRHQRPDHGRQRWICLELQLRQLVRRSRGLLAGCIDGTANGGYPMVGQRPPQCAGREHPQDRFLQRLDRCRVHHRQRRRLSHGHTHLDRRPHQLRARRSHRRGNDLSRAHVSAGRHHQCRAGGRELRFVGRRRIPGLQ